MMPSSQELVFLSKIDAYTILRLSEVCDQADLTVSEMIVCLAAVMEEQRVTQQQAAEIWISEYATMKGGAE